MAKKAPPSITVPEGFFAAGGTCGIKASGNPDLAMIVSDRPCAAAGVFTTSRTPAAPVAVNRRHLRNGRARALVVNSGNANASTGKPGEDDAERMCGLVVENLLQAGDLFPGAPDGVEDLDTSDVLVASTGIIGRPLPMDRIGRGVATLTSKLSRGKSTDAATARAIMTTDLVPKSALREVPLSGASRGRAHLGGICKGSGMVAPNMATMLAFITTDAAVAPAMLRVALKQAVVASFNRISVDQHTSPSDMVLILANGAAGNRPIVGKGRDCDAFCAALADLCRDLAEQIVRDGEGATKLMRVRVTGAKSEREADAVAKAVVNSPLVKCAIHGGDPNWGRITTAAGYSGAAVDPATMTLHLFGGPRGKHPGEDGGICVYRHGVPAALREAQMRRLALMMKKSDLTLTLDLGRGGAAVEWLGCDLSRQYIAINADYTT